MLTCEQGDCKERVIVLEAKVNELQGLIDQLRQLIERLTNGSPGLEGRFLELQDHMAKTRELVKNHTHVTGVTYIPMS